MNALQKRNYFYGQNLEGNVCATGFSKFLVTVSCKMPKLELSGNNRIGSWIFRTQLGNNDPHANTWNGFLET